MYNGFDTRYVIQRLPDMYLVWDMNTREVVHEFRSYDDAAYYADTMNRTEQSIQAQTKGQEKGNRR